MIMTRGFEQGPARTGVAFDDPDLLDVLESAADVDALAFGLIVMDRSGDVVAYNAYESARAGISPERVLGRNFFTSVGPCTDNYLVSERFRSEPDLDDELDYVFTLRMRPTPVRLRLLARAGSPRQYLVVRSR